MPVNQHSSEIDELRTESLGLSWFAGSFYPQILRDRLKTFSSGGNEQAHSIYQAASNIGFFQRLFFPSLRKFFKADTTAACRNLQAAGLFTQQHFDGMVNHPNPAGVARAISFLGRSRLLKEKNCNQVTAYAEPDRIVDVLRAIATVRQGDFDRLMRSAAVLFIPGVWSEVPAKSITSAQLQRILELAEAYKDDPLAGQAAFRYHFVYAVFLPGHMRDDDLRAIESNDRVNRAPCIHFASIDPSASKAAKRLKHCYGSEIGEILALNSLSKWLREQPRAPKIEAAIRGLAKIRHLAYAHTDPCSGVSIQELTALLWVAIKDDKKRAGTLKNARLRMIDALDGRVASTKGTFNKLIEIFRDIHQDVSGVMSCDKESTPLPPRRISATSASEPTLASKAGFFAVNTGTPGVVDRRVSPPSQLKK